MCGPVRSARGLCSRSYWLLWLAVWLCLVDGAAAQAASEAEAQFQAGLSDMQAGKYESGCPLLAASYRLDPVPGALFTLAECEAAWGRVATALDHYQAFVRLLPGLPSARRDKFEERRRIALEKIAALGSIAPELTIEVAADAPQELVVKRNGVVIDPSAYGVGRQVDPGEFSVTAELEGQPIWERHFSLSERDRMRVEIPAPAEHAAPAIADAPALDPLPIAPAEPPPSRLRSWVYAAGAVGVGGLVGGLVAGGIALGKRRTIDARCANYLCDPQGQSAANTAQRAALASTVSFAVGAAGVGAAALLFWARRRAAEAVPEQARVRASLSVGRGASVAVIGAF